MLKKMTPRNILKLLILVAGINSSVFAQSPLFGNKINIIDQTQFIVEYTLTFKEDSTNLNRIRKQDFLLFLGNDLSLFIGKTTYRDAIETRKIITQEQLGQWINALAKRTKFTRFPYRIFKNYPAGKITTTDHITSGSFIYEEELELNDWYLTSETDTIKNYLVQKATTRFGGRKWVAWFCPNIPFQDGPYKFRGLPGLILKLYDSREHYTFDLNQIYKPDTETAIEFIEKDYFKTTKMRFFRAEDYAKNNIVSTVKAMGNGIESQQKVAKKMAARNNPIELKRK